MRLADFYRRAAASLEGIYPPAEAQAMVRALLESVTGLSGYSYVSEPSRDISGEALEALESGLGRLLSCEPLQYVTGRAWFCGHAFRVSPDVLIPRPETELLVEEALSGLSEAGALPDAAPVRALDLCTGSGCIAWSLAIARPGTEVTAVDISEAALELARSQDFPGEKLPSGVVAPVFLCADVLEGPRGCGSGLDLIVANPPYILPSQRSAMRPNVLDYEPELALFVPEDDPLLFYRAVVAWAGALLRPGGRLLVEINDALAPETATLFSDAGLRDVRVMPDLSGRDRMVGGLL